MLLYVKRKLSALMTFARLIKGFKIQIYYFYVHSHKLAFLEKKKS